ncbi:hypothetical protein B0H63DRAFT_541538 [Podospora didyma]|uniref:Heterokaryon incompatibility domain-containing protein n=1 Tax=Podospora didyma TaxID=330526 RepID=A0AAE0NT91_9PEZI|nr:hypothetical protein B0H63DRAFT_541538 [Podospora didyma]
MATTTENQEALVYKWLYEPISSENLDIRVLNLEAGPDHDSGISCWLNTVSPMSNQSFGLFEALSYSWGDSSVLRDVLVNGQTIGVTPNLETFLRHRRETDKTVT